MGDSSAHQLTNQRLNSWKEIAAFFNRDERTVRRWEKERGLPIHRLPGGTRGGVFAYSNELKHWLTEPGHDPEPYASTPINPSSEPQTNNNHPDSFLSLASKPPALPVQPAFNSSIARVLIGIAPLLIVAVLIIVFSVTQRDTTFSQALAAPHAPNPDAQELYLKGEYHWSKRTPEDLNKAVDYFTQSIVKDPSYAQAYAGLADCYNLLREFSVMPPEDAYPRALAAAQKAVELDDNSPGAHNSLAFVSYYWNWDPITAEHEYKRALQLDPNLVQGHHWYATFLLASGRNSEALDQIEQARKLDPSSTAIQADKGVILNAAGRENEAFALLKQLESTDPALATTHSYLAAIYLNREDYDNFFTESKQSAQLRRSDAGIAVAVAAERGFARGGLHGMREGMLPVQKEMLNRGVGSAYDLASTCAALGNREAALKYLQTAYEKHEAGLLYLNRDPAFITLHGDLVYKEIVERMGQRLSRSSQS